jgi:chromosome segregation ATPase
MKAIRPLALCLLLLAPAASRADDAKVKETLRTLTLRLRTAETEQATLQGEKAQLEQEKKALTDKTDALTKQADSDKATIANLTSKSAEQDTVINQMKDALAKWKTAYEQVATGAQQLKTERDRAMGENIITKREVADREAKNRELYRLANEILTRYEKFGLGDALAAREPFTGVTRTKLESLVQDYADKIADARVQTPVQATKSRN